MYGFDISPDMVELARARVPDAIIECSSLHDVVLPRAVAVTAIGEALNYATDPRAGLESLERLAARVRDALEPGGVFLFDVATPGRNGPSPVRQVFHDRDDWSLYMRAEESEDHLTLDRVITVFRKTSDGQYRRSDEHHVLRLYEPDAVRRVLDGAGFDAARARHVRARVAGPAGMDRRRRDAPPELSRRAVGACDASDPARTQRGSVTSSIWWNTTRTGSPIVMVAGSISLISPSALRDEVADEPDRRVLLELDDDRVVRRDLRERGEQRRVRHDERPDAARAPSVVHPRDLGRPAVRAHRPGRHAPLRRTRRTPAPAARRARSRARTRRAVGSSRSGSNQPVSIAITRPS